MSDKFWQQKSLAELSNKEWESLCDGCGRCCLIKLEDETSGKLYYTSIVCAYLDLANCRCTDYAKRSLRQPDCIKLSKDNIDKLEWMPKTCAYRLLAAGKDLKSWHPLLSGSNDSVHEAGVSVRSFAMLEEGDEELEQYIINLK